MINSVDSSSVAFDPIADLRFDSINDYKKLFQRAKYARGHNGQWPRIPLDSHPVIVSPLQPSPRDLLTNGEQPSPPSACVHRARKNKKTLIVTFGSVSTARITSNVHETK
jgi:hypothetical protein